jgi:hypothetical protein
MAMGQQRWHAKQTSMQILVQHSFDGYIEGLCQRSYADEGRPGLPPGRDFRLLLIGYLEGLDAERAIAWRAGRTARAPTLCERASAARARAVR